MRVRKIIATGGEHSRNMLQFIIFRRGALRHQTVEFGHFAAVVRIDGGPCRLRVAMIQMPPHEQLAFMRCLVRLG